MGLFSNPATKNVGKFSKGYGVIRKLSFLFYFAFVLIMLLNAVVISYKANDITPGIAYLGQKWLLATEEINQNSVNILERGEILGENNGFFKTFWFFLKNFWGIIEAVFIALIWLQVLTWILWHFPIMDESKRFSAFIIALFVFFGLQVLFIRVFTEESLMFPFLAIFNLFRAFFSIIFPSLAKISKEFDINNTNDLINKTITEFSNKTG